MSIAETLYPGVPLWAQILFGIALAVAVLSFLSVIVLVVASARLRRRMRRRRDESGTLTAEDFVWVFLVPALNEEVTIADSVARLQAAEAPRSVIYVIDDGSSDRTGEILAAIQDPRLRVLTRVLPHARTGKADALNAAYRDLERLLAEPELAGIPRDRVIVGIVDADGRLQADAPASVARHFSDPRVAGVQVRVRIYNRKGPLTWAQDVEFSTFGYVFQAGRALWGTANMGGNGQFNRLSALDTIVGQDAEGPWRDRLCEDQDLGVRLLQAGWAGEHDNEATVDQQGLNSLRRLYRQRVRWAQGNWQSMTLLRGSGRVKSSFVGRLDAVWYLLTPPIQLFMGIAFVVSLVFTLLEIADPEPPYLLTLIFFLTIGFGPGVAALTLRGGKWHSVFTAIILVIPYTVYSWIIFPVLFTSLFRQLSGRTSWSKTAREPIAVGPADAEGPATTSG